HGATVSAPGASDPDSVGCFEPESGPIGPTPGDHRTAKRITLLAAGFVHRLFAAPGAGSGGIGAAQRAERASSGRAPGGVNRAKRQVFTLVYSARGEYGKSVRLHSARIPPTGGSALMPETTKQPDRAIGAEEDFGALFERSLKQPKQGEVVTGRVVLIGRDVVTIDIGYKSEGTIPIHEFTTREGEITVHEGDEIDVYFEASDTESGDIVLSRQKAEQIKVWREIERAYDREGAVEGTIVGRVKGALMVD